MRLECRYLVIHYYAKKRRKIFLDEEYKTALKNEYRGIYYERFINGNFVTAEGLVFPDIANEPHKYLISKAEVKEKYPKFRSVGVGYDLGGNKSNFALVATAVTYDNTAIVLRADEISPEKLNLYDVEHKAKDFIQAVEKEYGCTVRYCYTDDNYYTTINSLNNWRYIFDSASRIKSTMPLEDRPLMLNKLMAQGRFKLVDGACQPLLEQLQDAVFDGNSDRAIIQDNGSMCIDEIDAFFYSIADDYLYFDYTWKRPNL